MKTEDLKLFHQLVDFGSLTKTSERLNLPKSNISRRIKGLEDELNIQLFSRQNRAMQLTDSGSKFFDKTKAIMNKLEASIQEITAPSHEVSGSLRIQLLPLPMSLEIAQIIFNFMEIYPQISIEVITSSEDQNLLENNIDVALRVGETLEDSSLIARLLFSAPFGFYCTEKYIKDNMHPKTIEDLKKLNVIRYRFPNGKIYSQIPFNKDQTVNVYGNLIINSVPLIMEAALQNRGIIFIPEPVANFYIEKGMLVRLFNDIEPSISCGWLVYPYRKHLSLAARTFIDYMLEEIKKSDLFSGIESDLRGIIG